jgi:hypothetical protein
MWVVDGWFSGFKKVLQAGQFSIIIRDEIQFAEGH